MYGLLRSVGVLVKWPVFWRTSVPPTFSLSLNVLDVSLVFFLDVGGAKSCATRSTTILIFVKGTRQEEASFDGSETAPTCYDVDMAFVYIAEVAGDFVYVGSTGAANRTVRSEFTGRIWVRELESLSEARLLEAQILKEVPTCDGFAPESIRRFEDVKPWTETFAEVSRSSIVKVVKGSRSAEPEVRERIAASLRGRTLSADHRDAVSVATRGQPKPGLKGRKPWNHGKVTPSEVRAKISAARMGQAPWNKRP